ncbi:MAG: hypothetical protein GVX78_06150 [Bacteroidetes bacterium]|nr:hypothetical protein [Bacteroidota bacterium]
MTKSQIGYGLLLTVILAVITLVIANRNPVFTPHLYFYIICLIAFLLFTSLSLFVGLKTYNHRNPGLFGTAAISTMTFKMMVSILLVVVYVKVFASPDKWFVLPFFLMYLYFTVFEAWALIKIGRSTK